LIGPWEGLPGKARFQYGPWYRVDASPVHVAALRRAAALVPPGAAVTSTNKVGGHLSARRYVYSVPVIRRAKWMVLDARDPWLPRAGLMILARDPARFSVFVARIERSPSWHEVFREDGVLVFKRT
jgi:hypothetical protein